MKFRYLAVIKIKSLMLALMAYFIANGARSQLRPKAWVKVNKAYPWGLREYRARVPSPRS